jgi:hypothetical protein
VTTEERVERKTMEYCKVKTRLNKLYQELGVLQLQVVKEKYGVHPGTLVFSHGEIYKVHDHHDPLPRQIVAHGATKASVWPL